MQENTWRFPGPEPKLTSHREFVSFLHAVLKRGEVSWVVTDKSTYEWDQINLNRDQFFQNIEHDAMSRAFVGVFYPDAGRMEYSSFRF